MDGSILWIIGAIITVSQAFDCEKPGAVCLNRQQYQQCTNSTGNLELSGTVITCPEATICDHSTGTATCRSLKEREVPPAVYSDEPQCFGASKHPTISSCYQYYECVPVLWWWQPELKTCPEGTAFDSVVNDCAPQDSVQCELRSSTTTTTVPPPIDKPECTGPGKYPALQCYQYFECVSQWFKYEAKLKTCPNGQAFDSTRRECVCAGLVNCVLPDREIECDGPGNLAGLTCHEYYSCKQKLWWWQPVKEECPIGMVFHKDTCHCVPESVVPCFQEVPKCDGQRLYPASDWTQYYECVLDGTGMNWVAELKKCPSGTVFQTRRKGCIPIWLIFL